jgi:hypothetical protein
MSNDNHDDHGRFASGSGGGPAHPGGHANSVQSYNPKTGPSMAQKVANARTMHGPNSKMALRMQARAARHQAGMSRAPSAAKMRDGY